MGNLKILHLEDDALDADLVRREIAKIEGGQTWVSAGSAEEFYAVMAGERVDAIVSDSQVPGIDGLQALAYARERRPGIPFIFVSGNDDARWAEHCIGRGATDYVAKNALWRLPSAMKRLHEAGEAQRLAWLTASRGRLAEIVKQLSMARSVDAIVEIVRSGTRDLTGADGATFVLRDGELCHYVDEDAIAPLWKGSRFPMQTCISGWAMLHGRPAVIPDIYADARIPHDAYRPTFVKSLVMVPIRAEAPIGAIGSYWAMPHDATPDELALVQALADSTSLAFENVALVRDLEQRVQQRTAELQAINQELEAFSYSVSHDLRAPLRAIRGYGDLLAEAAPPLDGERQVFLQHIRQSAQRMDTLIDDMLTLSKVSRAELMRRPVRLGAMVRDMFKLQQAASPGRQVRLDIDAEEPVQGDPALLALALQNLVANAWKFTGKRDDAHIEFFVRHEPDGRVVHALRDNGAGFDMAHAQHLFEPFRRLHREADFPGTGVGLAIARRVFQKHGGELWAEAQPGRGATFYFSLPATAPG